MRYSGIILGFLWSEVTICTIWLLSRLQPKSVPLLVRAALGSRRHWSSSHHRSTFHFPFVLSCLFICKCMCTFSLVRNGVCTHLFVVLVTGGFMNKTTPLITQLCPPAPDFPAASYALPYNYMYSRGQKFWEWHKYYIFTKSAASVCMTLLQIIAMSLFAMQMNPQKTFPLHFSPATKGPADMSMILLLTQVWVLTRTRLEITVMLIEFK